MLTDLLGPRPPMGVRPQGLEALAVEVRRLLNAPGLNPDSHHEVLAALRRADLEVPDTRASTLRQLDHPVVAPLLRFKQLRSEEHTSELQSLMRISYAVFCLKKK